MRCVKGSPSDSRKQRERARRASLQIVSYGPRAMIGGRIGMVWSARVFGLWLAVGTALAACGSGDGHKQSRYCSEECPTERCDEATGACLPPEMEPSGGQPNEPNEPDPPSAGAVIINTRADVHLTSGNESL